MPWTIVGSCPKCGAPIYAESPWWGVTPPPSRYSCNCVLHPQPVTTTGTGPNIYDTPGFNNHPQNDRETIVDLENDLLNTEKTLGINIEKKEEA